MTSYTEPLGFLSQTSWFDSESHWWLSGLCPLVISQRPLGLILNHTDGWVDYVPWLSLKDLLVWFWITLMVEWIMSLRYLSHLLVPFAITLRVKWIISDTSWFDSESHWWLSGLCPLVISHRPLGLILNHTDGREVKLSSRDLQESTVVDSKWV